MVLYLIFLSCVVRMLYFVGYCIVYCNWYEIVCYFCVVYYIVFFLLFYFFSWYILRKYLGDFMVYYLKVLLNWYLFKREKLL